MVITRLLPSHYQPFSFTASDARGSQASLSAPNNGSRWRRLAAPGASIYSRSWEGRETSPWGEKRTLPPPPSTPVVGKAGKRRRGERREHCRRLHLLPLLGRQGNVAGVREGNTAAACYPHPVVGKAGKQRRGVRRRLARGAAARQPSSPLKKSP